MMALLFIVMTLSIGLAWTQYYRLSVSLFLINLGLSVVWFFYHATSKLPLHF